jgi:cysteine desulfurase
MFAHSEIGNIHPLREVALIAHARDIFVFSDIRQAAGKITVGVYTEGIDLTGFSAHKYGPKEIGALFMRAAKRKGPAGSVRPMCPG